MTFQSFIAAGVDLCFYGAVGSDGYLLGGTLTAPSAGSGTGSPMLRLKGVVGADATVQEPAVVDVPGDNGSQGSFVFPPDSQPSFTLEKSVFDLVLEALAQGTLTYDDGTVKLGILQPTTLAQPDLCWILQSPTKKKDSGVNGRKAWSGYIIPLSTGYPIGRNSFNTRQAASDRIRIAVSPADMLFDGLDIDDTNFGTEGGGSIVPFTSDYPIYFQRFTGNGTEDEFTLSHLPAAAAEVRIRVNGVAKTLTTDYTVNIATGVITFVAAPANNEVIVARVGMA